MNQQQQQQQQEQEQEQQPQPRASSPPASPCSQQQEEVLAHLKSLRERLETNDPSLTHWQAWGKEASPLVREHSSSSATTMMIMTGSLEHDRVNRAFYDCLQAVMNNQNTSVRHVSVDGLPAPELQATLAAVAHLPQLETVHETVGHASQSIPLTAVMPLFAQLKTSPLKQVHLQTRLAFSTQRTLNDMATALLQQSSNSMSSSLSSSSSQLESLQLHLLPRCSIQTPHLYLDPLIRALTSLPKLRSLHLTVGYEHNPYGRPMIRDPALLSDLVESNPRLERLVLDNWGLRDAHFHAVAQALHHNTVLQHLQLSRNPHVSLPPPLMISSSEGSSASGSKGSALRALETVLRDHNQTLMKCRIFTPTQWQRIQQVRARQQRKRRQNMMQQQKQQEVTEVNEKTTSTTRTKKSSSQKRTTITLEDMQDSYDLQTFLNQIGRKQALATLGGGGDDLAHHATTSVWAETLIRAATKQPKTHPSALSATFCLLKDDPSILLAATTTNTTTVVPSPETHQQPQSLIAIREKEEPQEQLGTDPAMEDEEDDDDDVDDYGRNNNKKDENNKSADLAIKTRFSMLLADQTKWSPPPPPSKNRRRQRLGPRGGCRHLPTRNTTPLAHQQAGGVWPPVALPVDMEMVASMMLPPPPLETTTTTPHEEQASFVRLQSAAWKTQKSCLDDSDISSSSHEEDDNEKETWKTDSDNSVGELMSTPTPLPLRRRFSKRDFTLPPCLLLRSSLKSQKGQLQENAATSPKASLEEEDAAANHHQRDRYCSLHDHYHPFASSAKLSHMRLG